MKLNFSKKVISLILSLLIIISVPVTDASAEQSDVSYVVYNTEWLRYDTFVCPAANYSIVTDELTDGWWVVNDDVTLNGLDIPSFTVIPPPQPVLQIILLLWMVSVQLLTEF